MMNAYEKEEDKDFSKFGKNKYLFKSFKKLYIKIFI
jgi:hypothetical protein